QRRSRLHADTAPSADAARGNEALALSERCCGQRRRFRVGIMAVHTCRRLHVPPAENFKKPGRGGGVTGAASAGATALFLRPAGGGKGRAFLQIPSSPRASMRERVAPLPFFVAVHSLAAHGMKAYLRGTSERHDLRRQFLPVNPSRERM